MANPNLMEYIFPLQALTNNVDYDSDDDFPPTPPPVPLNGDNSDVNDNEESSFAWPTLPVAPAPPRPSSTGFNPQTDGFEATPFLEWLLVNCSSVCLSKLAPAHRWRSLGYPYVTRGTIVEYSRELRSFDRLKDWQKAWRTFRFALDDFRLLQPEMSDPLRKISMSLFAWRVRGDKAFCHFTGNNEKITVDSGLNFQYTKIGCDR